MYHFEQRDKFWDGKAEELRNKLYSRPFGRSQNPPKLKPSPKEVNYEEMRLMNGLAKEEITELKTLLSSEKGRNLQLHRTNEELRGKVEELQDLNQSLTNLLVDKGKNSNPAPARRLNEKELNALKEELEVCHERLSIYESQTSSNKELMEARLAALKNELNEKNLLVDELHSQIKALQQQNSAHAQCEARLAEYLKQIQQLESQVFAVKASPKETSQKLQLLEEENQMLKEQIEIYQEDKLKGISEKEKMQQLSYLILSKDKQNTDLEALAAAKRKSREGVNGNDQIVEKNQLEAENKTLSARLNAELHSKLENLEKIRNLQEILMKIAPDCGYDHELTRVKAQIVAVKGQITGNVAEKAPSQVEMYEKCVEIDILKNEMKACKNENSKARDELGRNLEKVRELEVKVRLLEAGCNDQDFLCFVQCEAAALEDMLGGNCTQDMDSEDIY